MRKLGLKPGSSDSKSYSSSSPHIPDVKIKRLVVHNLCRKIGKYGKRKNVNH